MKAEAKFLGPIPLEEEHQVQDFDCGIVALNEYLKRYAIINHRNRSARTYAAICNDRAAGYYTLAAGSVGRDSTTPRVKMGLANYPVPVILLARLAVDRAFHGMGLGKGLLKDALLRALNASDLVGARAILVHAKDDSARKFYLQYGFEPSPANDLHLFLMMKDIRASLG